AFAMTSASQISDDVLSKQAQLRHASLRLADLLRSCMLVCAAPGNDIAVWRADTNGDGLINLGELVYLERGDGLDRVQISEFDAAEMLVLTLAELKLPGKKAELLMSHNPRIAIFLSTCKNVQFDFDAAPPFTQFVTITFDLTEDTTDHRYEISAALRSWAGHLLSATGEALVPDDD
ncbi:MAG: hypothetical protein JW741_09190, partial [Sedimentisphaerales bacterium]|nr:hypothetical protein [Sedimentisphaerales bacterium]